MPSPENTTKKQQLTSEIKANQKMIAVFEADAFSKEWAEGNPARTAQLSSKPTPFKFRDDTKTAIGYANDALSIAKFSKMAADMGLSGQISLKSYGNKPYIIFQSTGNLHHFVSQLKQRFNKSRHIKAQPKVVQMAVGNAEAVKGAVRGGMITFAIFTVVNIMDYIIRDQATFARLLGTITSDFAKISAGIIASAAFHAITSSTLIGAGITSAITLTLAPAVIAIAIGIGIGILLNGIDDNYKLTERLIATLQKLGKDTQEFNYNIKRELNYIEENPIQAFGRIFGTPTMPY